MTARYLLLDNPRDARLGTARDFFDTCGSHIVMYVLPCFLLFTLVAVSPRGFLSLGPRAGSITLLAMVFAVALPLHCFRQFQQLSRELYALDDADIGEESSCSTAAPAWSARPAKLPKSSKVVALEDALCRRLGTRVSERDAGSSKCRTTALDRNIYAPREWQQLVQAHADLEVPLGADLEFVSRAYRRRMYLFHPDRHFNDPVTHELAEELARYLAQAYSLIVRLRQKEVG